MSGNIGAYYNNGGSATGSAPAFTAAAPGFVTLTGEPIPVTGSFTFSGASIAVTQSGTFTVGLLSGATVGLSSGATVNLASGATVDALPAAAVSGGAEPFVVISLATTNAHLVKNAPGNLYGLTFANTSASAWAYVKLFNKATAPAPGTDTPAAVYPIPPGGTLSRGFPVGLSFSAGIGLAITTNPALNDNTAIGANQVVGTLEYA
jgi:hypothetical protein